MLICRDTVLKCIELWIKRSAYGQDIEGGGSGDNDGKRDESFVNCLGPHKPENCEMCLFLRKPCFKKIILPGTIQIGFSDFNQGTGGRTFMVTQRCLSNDAMTQEGGGYIVDHLRAWE